MIITHTDFDGLVSAFLLREITGEEKVYFTEPFLITKIIVTNNDYIADLPFRKECKLWFDHHLSNELSEEEKKKYKEKIVFNKNAKSAARVIYDYYEKKLSEEEKKKFLPWVLAADKIDSASLTKEEILNPDVYGLISLSLRSDDYKKDNEFRRYLLELMSFLKPEEIIKDKNIRERVLEKRKEQLNFLKKIKKPIYKDEKLTIIKVNGYARPLIAFLIHNSDYVLLIDEESKEGKKRISMSTNPFKERKTKNINIGALMKQYGGGGHEKAGGATINKDEQKELIRKIREELNIKTKLEEKYI